MVGSALIFETCTPEASIALVGADGEIDQRSFCSDRNHNAVLFGPLQELIAKAPPASIEMILVGSGPGSYSGTRVGIAAAQGVAIALGCPAVAVPSLLAVPSVADGARCMAVGDARRGTYWTANLENCLLQDEPALCDAVEFEQKVTNALSAGVIVFSLEEPARFPLREEILPLIKTETPDALRLWLAWSRADDSTRQKWAAEIPQPVYLKPPHITPAKRKWLVPPI